MSEHQEIRRLISDEAGSDEERKELLQVARRLEVTLAREVEARPTFKSDLRRRLLAEHVREQTAEPPASPVSRPETGKVITLWRRASTWGWTAGAVAAAVMLAALSYNAGTHTPQGGTPVPPGIAPGDSPLQWVEFPTYEGKLVTVANLPDVIGAPADYFVGLKAGDRVAKVDYKLATVLPSVPSKAELLAYKLEDVPVPGPELVALAQRAGFAKAQPGTALQIGESTRPGVAADFAAEKGRWLNVDTTGLLTYTDDRGEAMEPAQRTVATAAQAAAAAREFLGKLGLVSPGDQPAVSEGQFGPGAHAWRVEWTPREPAPGMPGDSLPLIGQPVTVIVADNGVISRAGVQLGRLESQGFLRLKSPEEALTEMKNTPVAGKVKQLSITVQQVDLVYGRPQAGGASPVYAVPYYRFSGVTEQGWAITRYVPAVSA